MDDALREKIVRMVEARTNGDVQLTREAADIVMEFVTAARHKERKRCAAALNHHVQAHRSRGDDYAAEIAGRALEHIRALPDEEES